VAATGWGQLADRDRFREAGFDHHLVKPLEAQALIQVLVSRAAAGDAPGISHGPAARKPDPARG
jgi:CheY-like chemotaxis protein